MPGPGGSYLYLLEAFGKERWGKLMAFLFVWQFLISGPLEVGSALIGIATFSNGVHPNVAKFNSEHDWHVTLFEDKAADLDVGLTFNLGRFFAFAVGVLIVFLLYRRITSLGWLTITVWLGVLGVLVWILIEGLLHADLSQAFDADRTDAHWPASPPLALGKTMLLAMYAYLGYYNICYLGDEVREPGKNIPRSVMVSAVTVILLFTGTHIAMLGVIPWTEIPRSEKELDTFSLAAEFMRRVHGDGAASVVSLLLIWCCFGSVFAALLGYSRIPYGAARYGHFFRVFAAVQPQLRIPHVALLTVGSLTLCWSFFDLGSVINALITTRIIEQFIAQIVGVIILRKTQPDRPRSTSHLGSTRCRVSSRWRVGSISTFAPVRCSSGSA